VDADVGAVQRRACHHCSAPLLPAQDIILHSVTVMARHVRLHLRWPRRPPSRRQPDVLIRTAVPRAGEREEDKATVSS
jgi:hypothetical protein